MEDREYFKKNRERFVKEWSDFLAFPSVGTDPDHRADCIKTAEWLSAHLSELGFDTKLLETPGLPVVFGEWRSASEAPTVAFYGHYDVQPADPVELWQTPPFEPSLRDNRLYARGAQDNKGQVWYFLKAVEMLLRQEELPVNLKIFIEGEEESGSTGIMKKMNSWQDELSSDVLMVCDTGSRMKEVCAITMGLRGIAGLTVSLSGPRTDLHSGVHGGVAPNPAGALARLLSSLHDQNGRIAVSSFYDDVEPAAAEDLAAANSVSIPDEVYQELSGVLPRGGERGLTFAERRGFQPTIEVNGFHSGYGGPGMKTIIPASATAKISTRLVAGQEAEKTLNLIEEHLKDNAPEGLQLTISDKEVGGPAVRVPLSSKPVQLAREVLTSLEIGEVELMWEGASIPVVTGLARAAGAEPLLVGFGLEQDNMHAPNESFDLDQFEKGFLYVSAFLRRASELSHG